MTIALPFATPAPHRVEHLGWSRHVDGRAVPLDGFLEDWDRTCTADLTGTLEIDVEGLLTDLGLSSVDELCVWTEVETGTTGSRTTVQRQRHAIEVDEETRRMTLQLPTVHGSEVASVLRLRTTFLLSRKPSKASGFTPRLPGAILWQLEHLVALDGSARGFPVHPVAFAEVFRDFLHAPWFVEVLNAEPHAPFMSAVVVFINSDRAEVHRALERGDAVATGLLNADIIRTVIETVLAQDTALDGDELELAQEGTVGAEVYRWLRYVHEDCDQAIKLVREDPNRAAARVASTWSLARD